MSARAWRGGRLDPRALATGVLRYRITPERLDAAAFERIVAGLEGRFLVTRRAPTSVLFERGEGIERPRSDPFRSVDWGGVDLSGGEPVAELRRRLTVTLAIRSQLGFLTFGFVAAWLIGFHDSNPLWWTLVWGAMVWGSVTVVRRRVGARLRDWAEGAA